MTEQKIVQNYAFLMAKKIKEHAESYAATNANYAMMKNSPDYDALYSEIYHQLKFDLNDSDGLCSTDFKYHFITWNE